MYTSALRIPLWFAFLHSVCEIHPFEASSWLRLFRAKYIHETKYYVIKLSFLFSHLFRLFQSTAAIILCICLWVPGRLAVGWWGCRISTLSVLLELPDLSAFYEWPIFLPNAWHCQTSIFFFFWKSDRSEILSHCGFNLWFPDYKFSVFMGCFHFCEVSIHIFCLFLFHIAFFLLSCRRIFPFCRLFNGIFWWILV